MKIGTKIKKLRELRGIPQKEMARKLKLSLNGYSKIEREEVEPTITRLKTIADILNIDMHIILDFDTELFLNSLKEMRNTKMIIEDLKKENTKLWLLIKSRLHKKNPPQKTEDSTMV